MKKKTLLVGLLLVLTCGFSTVVSAEEVQTVSLNKNNQLVYTGNADDLEAAFQGMAPGDTKTVSIKVENNSSQTADFFISQETAKVLETANKSSGGAYAFTLEVGNDSKKTSILDAVAGGYANDTASTTGLADIDELENYQYFAKIGSGSATYVYLTLAIDGEGFDSNANVNDYSNATGLMNFNFRAYYPDTPAPTVVTQYTTTKGQDTVLTQIVDQIVPLASGVQTGDPMSVGLLLIVLAAGAGIVVVAVKKRKVESK